MRLSLLAATLAAISSVAGAAELGSLSLVSRLGEPFDARLDVRDVKPGEIIEVTLGDPSLYEKVGRKLAPEVTTFRIANHKDAKGRFRIQSREALKTDAFPLILVMKADSKVKAKVYNIKLAPPRSISRNTPSKAPVVVEHRENTAALRAPKDVKKTVAAPVEPVAAKKAPLASKAPMTAKANKPVPSQKVTQEEKKPTRTTLPEKPHAPIHVTPGMTLWSIAGKVQALYPRASIDRIEVALVRANPQAFKNGRVTGLKLGSRLRIPSAELINSIAEQEAWAIVRVKPSVNALKKPTEKRMLTAKKKMPASRLKTHEVLPPKAQTLVVSPVKAARPKTEPSESASPSLETRLQGSESAKPQGAEPAPQGNLPEAGATRPLTASDSPMPQASGENKDRAAPAPQPEAPQMEPEAATQKLTTTKPKKSGMPWGTIFGALAVLAALFGGGVYWRRRRKTHEDTEVEKPQESPVRFCREQPETSPEQLREIDETVSRRIESDERAAQGFELKGEDATQARPINEPESVCQEEISEPQTEHSEAVVPETAAEHLGTSETGPSEVSLPATNTPSEPSEAENNGPEQNEPEPVTGRIEPTLGIDLGHNATQDNAPTDAGTSAEPSFKIASDESLDRKLVQARSLLQSSLSDHAIELLEEIALKGNDEQRAAALKLLTEKQP